MSLFRDEGPGTEERAHQIARDIVAQELASIDRMHSRTMRYIGGFATVITVLFGVLGWIGYEKLQQIVLDATLRKVQEQTLDRVNVQVDKDLKGMDVEGLISRKVGDFAKTDLRSALTSELEHGPVHDEIRRLAATAGQTRGQPPTANNQSSTILAPSRSLTDLQRKKFSQLAVEKHLVPPVLGLGQHEDKNTAIARGVQIFVVPGDTEAYAYAVQLKDLFGSIGWLSDVMPLTPQDPRFNTGLHLIWNPNPIYENSFMHRSNEALNILFSCIVQADIPASTGEIPDTAKPRNYTSSIAVGSR